MVKFPLVTRTLVATGDHFFNGSATFVLIKVILVFPDCPLTQLRTTLAPDKLMPAMFGRLTPATATKVRLDAVSLHIFHYENIRSAQSTQL